MWRDVLTVSRRVGVFERALRSGTEVEIGEIFDIVLRILDGEQIIVAAFGIDPDNSARSSDRKSAR